MMQRVFAATMVALLVLATSATSQAATVTRLFAGTLTQTNGDFANLATFPRDFILKVTFSDSGIFIQGDWLRIAGVAGDIPLVTGNNLVTNYTIGNGATDTLSLTVLTNLTGNGEQMQFVVSSGPNAVNDNAKTVSNINALLDNQPFGGTSVSWINSATGTGYSGLITAVPEPGTMGLLIGAVATLGFRGRRRK